MKAICTAFLLLFSGSSIANYWPDWVTQQQLNNEYLIAVGIGDSRKAAKQAALADIATYLNVEVKTHQSQLNRKIGQHVQSSFEQATSITSLVMNFVGVEEKRVFKSDTSIALEIAIKKSNVINSLKSELEELSRITVPQNSDENRFVWALKYSDSFSTARKKLAVLEYLSGHKSEFKTLLLGLMNEQANALANVSCQVIGSSTDHKIISALNSALPQTGETLLWIRPQIRWQYAQGSNEHLAKANLTLQITRTTSPFYVLLEHTIEVKNSGLSRESAQENVINELVQQLKKPASQWLFSI